MGSNSVVDRVIMSPWRTLPSVSAGLVCVSICDKYEREIKRGRLNEPFQEIKTPLDSKFNSQMDTHHTYREKK